MSCSSQQEPESPIFVARGASKTLRLTVYNINGSSRTLKNITGSKIWFTAKNRVDDVVALIIKKNTIAGGVDNQAIISPQTGVTFGQFEVFIDPADTAPLDPEASYWCDAWIELPGGPPLKRYQVMKNRRLVVEPAVTVTF